MDYEFKIIESTGAIDLSLLQELSDDDWENYSNVAYKDVVIYHFKREKIGKAKRKTSEIDFVKLMNFFNDNVCSKTSIPRIYSMGNTRKTAVKSRIIDTSKEDLINVFKKCVDSDFLSGRKNIGWTATFDWIIKDSNFNKIREGNYDNERMKKDKSSFDYSEKYGDIFKKLNK